MNPKQSFALGAFAISLPLDLLTKWIVERNLSYADRIPVIEGFFYLTHVRNPGAAFGLFADGDPQTRLFVFIAVSIAAVLIILSFFRQLAPGDRLSALALGLILGGAVGNLLDRIFRGEVVDFLHFKIWRGYSWPDFNSPTASSSSVWVYSCSSCSRAKGKIGPRPNPTSPRAEKSAPAVDHPRVADFSIAVGSCAASGDTVWC
jgi:signal peptidase II